jgi:hypothetical protein
MAAAADKKWKAHSVVAAGAAGGVGREGERGREGEGVGGTQLPECVWWLRHGKDVAGEGGGGERERVGGEGVRTQLV